MWARTQFRIMYSSFLEIRDARINTPNHSLAHVRSRAASRPRARTRRARRPTRRFSRSLTSRTREMDDRRKSQALAASSGVASIRLSRSRCRVSERRRARGALRDANVFANHRFERAVVPPRLGDVERTTCGNRCLLLVASRRSRVAQIESISRRATDDDDARFRRAQVESRPSTSR